MKRLIKLLCFVGLILIVGNCFAMADFRGRSLVAKSAPEFSLPGLNSNTVNSSEFIGKKPALLFFWATWCPHCRTAIKDLDKIAASLESKGAVVITIDVGEKPSLVSSYMQQNNYNLTVLLDNDSVLVEPYGIIGVPTFFFVGRDGKIRQESNSLPADFEKILLGD